MEGTIRYTPKEYGTTLVILENGHITSIAMDRQSSWTIGRKAAGNAVNISLQSPIASRKHGMFLQLGDSWYYVDEPENLNGTYYNSQKIPRPLTSGEKSRVKLANGDILRIDNDDLYRPDSRGVWMLFTTDAIGGKWDFFPLEGKNEVRIGRDPGCDLCQPLNYLSRVHTRIVLQDGRHYIQDCNSTAGTWVNNRRVEGTQLLQEKDTIALCDCRFIYTCRGLVYIQRAAPSFPALKPAPSLEPTDSTPGFPVPPIPRPAPPAPPVPAPARYPKPPVPTPERYPKPPVPTPVSAKPVLLQANIRSRRVPNNSGHGMKELIRDIRLDVRQGTLVALLGPSGAGKSTVMNCLNGMETQGMEGTVYFNGEDLVANFERLKHLIGSVPQSAVFHKVLTPESELRDAAILRLPGDTPKREIEQRVDSVLKKLKLDPVRKTPIGKLSGGEQRRMNIAIELVADRALWCLDEPDAGLDPQTKRELFTMLRDLAHNDNKSILTIIHDVSEIDLFDQVILLAKKDNVGRLAFSGSPAEGRAYFGTELKDAYSMLEKDPEKYIKN